MAGRRGTKGFVLWLIVIAISVMVSGQASAHALLQKAEPSPGAHLDSPPAQIRLTFNERMEKGLYRVGVYGQDGEPVKADSADMSDDRKQLILELPTLADGIYTISYRVISIDGHPVEGSYTIAVGEAVQPEMDRGGAQMTEAGHSAGSEPLHILLFMVRILYYLTLLCLVGWVWWSGLTTADSPALRRLREQWLYILQWCFLLSLVAMIGVEFFAMSLGVSMGAGLRSVLQTNFGLLWAASLALSVSGFFILRRTRWLGMGWVALILVVESMNGHAAAFQPARAIGLDFIHLVASAIWAGGLLYLLVHRIRFQSQIARFLPQFSRAALISIVALVVTGAGSTLLYLPRLEYVLYTAWGTWLLAKIVCVMLVVLTGAALRRGMRRRQDARISALLKVDVGLMVLIVGIVGIFTYFSPVPMNQPLHWIEAADAFHVETTIMPNAPGPNHFQVKVSQPEAIQAPKEARLLLRYLDNKELSPLNIPLTRGMGMDSVPSAPGYSDYYYMNEGSYIPFPGKWELELRVMDANDQETVYQRKQIMY